MNKITIILIVLVTFFSACTEKQDQQEQQKAKFDAILQKIKDGKGKQSDLNELFESMPGDDGYWQVNFPKAKFRIVFPVPKVKESKTKQIIYNEEFEIFHYTANLQGKDHVNLGYQLDYSFLPQIKTKEEIDDLFNDQRDYLLSATNSKLEMEEIIEKNGAPGRHLYFTVDESNIKINYKMYFKNGIFYRLSVVTEEGKLFNKSISNFFNSFAITE